MAKKSTDRSIIIFSFHEQFQSQNHITESKLYKGHPHLLYNVGQTCMGYVDGYKRGLTRRGSKHVKKENQALKSINQITQSVANSLRV